MLKQKVLQQLRASDDFVSGQQISQACGVSRAAVWKAVEALRQEGYVIESVTRRGYRLQQTTPQLCQEEILAALPADHPWRDYIHTIQQVDSTNTVAKKLAAQGAPEGTIVVADQQTSGRGRLGRQFFSPAGVGVYLTVILRPKAKPEQILHLTAMTAEAICQAVEKACGVRPQIKWTNDLILNQKKLSGTLTELSVEAESGMVQYVVAGIGINCNQNREDFDPEIQDVATSLRMQTGTLVDRNRLAAAQIMALYEMSRDLLGPGRAQWLQQYSEDCITLGQEIKIVRGDQVRYARAEGLTPDAALVVSYADGSREEISCGEVSIRGMYGYV